MKPNDPPIDPERSAQADNGDVCWLTAGLVAIGTICVVLWHEVAEGIRRLAR